VVRRTRRAESAGFWHTFLNAEFPDTFAQYDRLNSLPRFPGRLLLKRVRLLTVVALTLLVWCCCGPEAKKQSAEPRESKELKSPAVEAVQAKTPPETSRPPASEVPEPATSKPAEGQPDGPEPTPSPPDEKEPPPLTPEQKLQAAIKAKNPKFTGEVAARSDGRDIRVVAVNDPAIEDISPLEGLPLVGLDLRGCRVSDIGPLKGMPLEQLYLEDNRVRDISALRGMPLVELYLSNTRVEDLSPLKGARFLQKLNLVGTRVSDLSPLRGTPIQMLWLTGCPVRDISPLRDVPTLVSLTIAETKVSDLNPLKGHSIRRLHIAGSEVTDLSPLEWTHLTRLIFTPGKITKGMDVIRDMSTLGQLDTQFPHPSGRRPLSPAVFWELYKTGKIK